MADEASTRVHIALQEGMRFEATGEDGISVMLDASPHHPQREPEAALRPAEGTGGGFRPLELLLVGLGACTAMDVISILRKKRQRVTAYRVEVSAHQTAEYPKVFTDICLRHIFHGEDLSREAVARSIELSETKYCPAFAMLEQAAQIDSTFEIYPAGPPD